MGGGTIVAESYLGKPTPRRVTVLNNGRVEKAVRDLCPENTPDFKDWSIKDSNEITDKDLLKLVDIIKNAKQHKILITHGTDRLAQNGLKLKKRLEKLLPADLGKVIVITGAMTPLSHGPESDGYKNLDDGLKFTEKAKPGFYALMKNKAFYIGPNLRKNFAKKSLEGTEVSTNSIIER